MWSPSANDVGVAFCCCFRSVRSACRSDLICRISDWISAKKESSLSSLSGLITANLKPLLDVNRPSTCKGCCKPYQRQLKNGRQWRKFVSVPTRVGRHRLLRCTWPPKKIARTEGVSFLRFQNWLRGVGRGLYAVFRSARREKFAFVFFNAGLPGSAGGRAPGRRIAGQHLTQLPDWYGLGQLRYCVLANPVLMAKPCPISMPS
jgi:hypothetical protein